MSLGHFNDRNVGNHDLLCDGRNFEGDRKRKDLADGEIDVLLDDGGETALGDGESVATGRQAQKLKMAVGVGRIGADIICIEILCFD